MIYEILDANGAVANRIEATESFVEQQHPGKWRLAEVQDVPAEPINPVPQSISMRQARLALLQTGKLQQISSAITSLPYPQKEEAEIEWQYSNEVQRYNGLVSLLAPTLGLSETDLDELFILAASK